MWRRQLCMVLLWITGISAFDYDYGLANRTFQDYNLEGDFKIYTRKCCDVGEAFFVTSNQCAGSSEAFVVPAFLTRNSYVLNITTDNMHIESGVLTACSPATMSGDEFLLLDNGELFSGGLNQHFPPSQYCLENSVDDDGDAVTSELIAAYCPTAQTPSTYDPHKIAIRKCCAIDELVASESLECKYVEDSKQRDFSVQGFGSVDLQSDAFNDVFEFSPGYPECVGNERGELLGPHWDISISNQTGHLKIVDLGIETTSFCIDQFQKDSTPMAYVCIPEPLQRRFRQMDPSCQDASDLCVDKCCPFGELLNSAGKCIVDHRKTSHQTVFVYTKNASLKRVDNVDFNFGFPHCGQRGLFITQMEEKGRLLSNGSLQYVSYDPSECNPYIEQLIRKRDFCYDMVEYSNFGGVDRVLVSGALICYPEVQHQTYRQENQVNYIYTIFLIISDIFIFISFIVYLTVPDQTKRGLNKNIKLGHSILGRILLCFLFSLFFAYLCLIVTKTASDPINMASNTACISVGIIMYISFLATFFWLNVLCFELWWKCARQERSSGRRWLWYQVYAWGNPLLLGSLVLFIEFYPRVGPCFVKPNFGVHTCFFSETRTFGSTAKWLYLNGPVAVLLVADLIFFLLTVKTLLHTVNQSHKGTVRRQARQRLRLAFKLFLVMGICWLTEIVSAATNTKWYITEVFNCLQGFIIFLIFILKPKILAAVRNRFCSSCCGKSVEEAQRGRSGFTASSVLFDFFTSTRHHRPVSSNNPSISSSSTNSSSISISTPPLSPPTKLPNTHSFFRRSS